MKKIIILGNSQKLDTISHLENVNGVVTFDLSVEYEKIEKNIPVIYFHRFAQEKNNWARINSRAQKWLKEWHKKKLENGKTILELFKFQELSLWWIISNFLWTEKEGIFESIYYFETLNDLLKTYNPTQIEIIGKFDYPISKILKCFQSKYSFELLIRKSVIDTRNVKTSRILYLIDILKMKIISIGNKKPIVIFSENSNQWYFRGLEEFFKNNSSKIEFISNKNFTKFFPTIFLLKRKSIERKIQKKIIELENENEFRETWNFEGVDVYPMIQNLFREKLPMYIFLAKLELLSAENFAKKYKPKKIVTTDMLNLRAKALAYTFRNSKTRVIALQVGHKAKNPIIDGNLIHEDYDQRLLPELFVWGEFYEELFSEWEYPKLKITNVGFFMARKGKKLQLGEYILFLAAANFGKYDYIHRFDDEIFTIKKIREKTPSSIKIIVKLHPTHPLNVYEKFLKNEKGVLITNEHDIYDLIENSKIIVAKFTTAVLDAITKCKPIILVNFGNNSDFMGINDLPFAHNPEEFQVYLEKLFENDEWHINSRKKFFPIGQTKKLVEELLK
ncbi:MAG: hypothetical protein K5790_09725 [Nitrosopumilus sp.]|uniref:hypothetical protein n=1 Tax=Nitrosopumilus sp. TaxID=2024843 RepID=UPI00247DF577|nr:hypothetical protein [Nitrosopumilus sp.]MCV0393549.1 hypothetical protein [Nitrosopumilus sp.]